MERFPSQRCIFRQWFGPEVATLAAKGGICAGPGSEPTHAVVNLLGGADPVDAPVFFFQDGSNGGSGVILGVRKDCAGGERAQGLLDVRLPGFGHACGESAGSLPRYNATFS